MIDKQILFKEIEALPPHVINEVYDYVTFLKFKKMQEKGIDAITLASENSLSKDWLLPEEDSAWANL